MEYAHRVSTLKIGQVYLVAHAKIVNEISGHHWADVPVIPIPHLDKAFAPGIKEHYHLDIRFGMPFYVKSKFRVENYHSNCPVMLKDWLGYNVVEIIFKPKKCLRLNTGINPPEKATKYWKWYESMLGKSCKGKKCPHYGATMIEADGKIYCPMHHLHADPITLKVVNPY